VGAGSSNIPTTATTSDSIHSSNNNNNNNNMNRLEAAAAAMEAMGGMMDASAVAHHPYFHGGGVPHTTPSVHTNTDNTLAALSTSQAATHNQSRIRQRHDHNTDEVVVDDLEPSPYNHNQLGGGDSGSGDSGTEEPLYKRYRTL